MIDQPATPPVPVYEFCEESARVVTKLSEGESVKVISSLAGGKESCYKVRFTQNGKVIEGYVIGPLLPEIEAYKAARQTDLRAGRFIQPASLTPIEPPKPPVEPAAKPEAAAPPPPPPPKPVPTVPVSKVG